MQITQVGEFNYQVDLTWDDWTRLQLGHQIGDRYDGVNKLLLEKTDLRSHATFDRQSMDITAVLNEQGLGDVRIPYCEFSMDKGNLNIVPSPDSCEQLSIKITYPGSLRVVNVEEYMVQ